MNADLTLTSTIIDILLLSTIVDFHILYTIVDRAILMAAKHRRSQTVRTLADIANLIVSTRHARRLTQAQLAKNAGVSRAWLAAVEGGKPRVDFSLILQTLAALGVTLVAGTDEGPKHPAQKRSTAVTPDDIDNIIRRASTRSS